jgi:anti-sigma factor RsiW
MSLDNFTDAELLAYLDESLAVERMTAIEQALRGSEALRQRAAAISRRRDHGTHSVGDSWRRWRLSCPTRHQLGSYLLGALAPSWAEYLDFHLQTVGCRFCAANVQDLRQSLAATPEVQRRRQKFFESSAGHVRDLQRKSS